VNSYTMAVYTLARREVVRFLRQRNRVFGALAQPILFWLIFGAGLSASFRAGAGDRIGYTEYFFPGVVAMILLFTAIFATISIIDDRNSGFLQGVLVSPVPTSAIVLGKVVGTTVLAVGQALLVCILAPLAGMSVGVGGILASIPIMVLLAVALAGLGMLIAWRMDSTQGFHAIMTSVLMPMWLLSGAFFPAEGTPGWLAWIIALNPMTYGVAALRHALYPDATMSSLPSATMCVLATVAFAAATLTGSFRVAAERTSNGLP